MEGDEAGRVKEAAGPDEREAIYRFRYTVYGRELGRKLGGADDARGWVRDEADEERTTTHLYTEDDAGITGAIRVRHWRPGQVPPHVWRTYSMGRFAALSELSVAELGRFMIRPDRRGHSTLIALGQAAYACMAGTHGTDVTFAYCAPGLLRHYRRLGLRPYGEQLISTPDGVEIPLVAILSDSAHFDSVGSFLAPLVPRYFGPGLRPGIDAGSLGDSLRWDESPVEVDATAVWSAVQSRLAGQGHPEGTFLLSMPRASVERLAAKGFLLRVRSGDLVTEKGLRQRELFVVLEGLFEATDGKRRLRIMSEGDVMGEIAFFHGHGRRTASIRAVTDGVALVIRRHAVDELRAEDPATAADLLLHLAQAMALRVVESV